VATGSEPLKKSEFFLINANSIISFVPQCLVKGLGRLRTKLVGSFFGGCSTNKPFSIPYAEIQRFFSAKLLQQNLFKI
jgi:hypothetical protein